MFWVKLGKKRSETIWGVEMGKGKRLAQLQIAGGAIKM